MHEMRRKEAEKGGIAHKLRQSRRDRSLSSEWYDRSPVILEGHNDDIRLVLQEIPDEELDDTRDTEAG